MYVANAVDKSSPYQLPDRLPPYRGREYAPALPDAGGHFDRIPEGSPQFRAAHLYGTVRRVLDIWEKLLGHQIVWWHVDYFPRLELVPTLRWGNAHSGPGFLETGSLWSRSGEPQELCLNFDAVAHEVGHVILFSVLGAPQAGRLTGAFLAFHETFADHVAAISSLYFDSVIERLPLQTNGNLYALNLVSRIGELSGSEEVRVLDNDVAVSDLAGLRLGPGRTWIDPSGIGRNEHTASAPLSGAIWDCLVELFQDALVRCGLISAQLDTRRWTKTRVRAALAQLHAASGIALQRFRTEFGVALREARDITGLALARCIHRLEPDNLDFNTVASRFCEAAIEFAPLGVLPAFLENFQERDIDPTVNWGNTTSLPDAVALRRSRISAPVDVFGRRWSTSIDNCRGRETPHAVAAVNDLIRHPHRGVAALSGR
jgi:hypothetical protein